MLWHELEVVENSDNNINLARGRGEHTLWTCSSVPLYCPLWEDSRDKEREVHVCVCMLYVHTLEFDGCIQLLKGALDRKSSSRHSRPRRHLFSLKRKERLSAKIPSPTHELLYEALSQRWHKDNCLPHSPHTHSPCLSSNNKFKILQADDILLSPVTVSDNYKAYGVGVCVWVWIQAVLR